MKTGTSTATTLSAPGYTIGNTSITVASTTNWPTDTGVIFAIDVAEVVDGEQVRVAGTYCEFQGTVASGTSINNLTLTLGTPQNYSAGSLTRVYIPVSSEREERMVDGILAEHKQDGTHGNITATGLTVTNAVLTTPKITTSINDANGNEVIKTPATASAVNELTITNAATGNAVQVSATGGDTNISVKGVPKGTGVFSGFMAVKTGVISGATLGSTGNKAVTGVGFTPKLVRFTILPSSSTTNMQSGSGAMTSSTQYSTAGAASTTGASRNSSTSLCFFWLNTGSATAALAASYVSMDSDGFTVNVSTASSSFDVAWEAWG